MSKPGDLLLIVPYKDPTFGTMTFSVCTVEDLMWNLADDEPEPDEMYDEGIIGAIQRAAIDAPISVGMPKPQETMGYLERAAASNSAETFTYWTETEEPEP